MSISTVHELSHQTVTRAPAGAVYEILADAREWPRVFPPCVHVERTVGSAGTDTLRLWCEAAGGVRRVTVTRTLDEGGARIAFTVSGAPRPVVDLGGTWLVEPLPDDSSRIRLTVRLAVDGRVSAAAACRVRRSVGALVAAEVTALGAYARRDADHADRPAFDLSESIRVASASRAAYDLVRDAGRWAERLAHVASARLEPTEAEDVDLLEVTARMPGGHLLTTRSYRVRPTPDTIVTKDVLLPALMSLHLGSWTFRADGPGLVVTCRHTVALDQAAVEAVLGADAGVDTAMEHIRDGLSTNDRATLRRAKEVAEAPRPVV